QRDPEADPHAARAVGGDHAEEASDEHGPLEGDVRDAAPLGGHPAEGRERDRRGQAQCRREHARADQHLPRHAIASTGLRPRRRVSARTSASAAMTNSTNAWMIATRFEEIPACDCMYAPPCTNAP